MHYIVLFFEALLPIKLLCPSKSSDNTTSLTPSPSPWSSLPICALYRSLTRSSPANQTLYPSTLIHTAPIPHPWSALRTSAFRLFLVLFSEALLSIRLCIQAPLYTQPPPLTPGVHYVLLRSASFSFSSPKLSCQLKASLTLGSSKCVSCCSNCSWCVRVNKVRRARDNKEVCLLYISFQITTRRQSPKTIAKM